MRLTRVLVAVVLAALTVPDPARAVEGAPAGAAPPDPVSSPDALDAQRHRLAETAAAAAAAEAERRRTEDDLGAIEADRARLAAALVAASARVRDAEARASAAEGRLAALADRDGAVRRSLDARRDETARVLAALQRLGLHPLPALLAGPGDVVDALRSAGLLGALLPELRSAAAALASDLAELGRLRALAAGERDALRGEATALGAERATLSDLVAARQAAQAAAEGALDGERRRAAELARDAAGVKELVARLEQSASAARRAAEADAAGVLAKAAVAGARDPARFAPATPFAEARGRLTLPAVGRTVRSFGDADGFGGQERGQSLATRPGALVTAPADGWVSFSGPYRSYGQLVILTMGDGYYVVMAGLARIDAVPGQFVLAGEPVGVMGDGPAGAGRAIAGVAAGLEAGAGLSAAAAAATPGRTLRQTTGPPAAPIGLGGGDPVLYVEFRKDGAAIDPAPWWAKAESQKVRG